MFSFVLRPCRNNLYPKNTFAFVRFFFASLRCCRAVVFQFHLHFALSILRFPAISTIVCSVYLRLALAPLCKCVRLCLWGLISSISAWMMAWAWHDIQVVNYLIHFVCSLGQLFKLAFSERQISFYLCSRNIISWIDDNGRNNFEISMKLCVLGASHMHASMHTWNVACVVDKANR